MKEDALTSQAALAEFRRLGLPVLVVCHVLGWANTLPALLAGPCPSGVDPGGGREEGGLTLRCDLVGRAGLRRRSPGCCLESGSSLGPHVRWLSLSCGRGAWRSLGALFRALLLERLGARSFCDIVGIPFTPLCAFSVPLPFPVPVSFCFFSHSCPLVVLFLPPARLMGCWPSRFGRQGIVSTRPIIVLCPAVRPRSYGLALFRAREKYIMLPLAASSCVCSGWPGICISIFMDIALLRQLSNVSWVRFWPAAGRKRLPTPSRWFSQQLCGQRFQGSGMAFFAQVPAA